jgi:hypothetical protein
VDESKGQRKQIAGESFVAYVGGAGDTTSRSDNRDPADHLKVVWEEVEEPLRTGDFDRSEICRNGGWSDQGMRNDKDHGFSQGLAQLA